MYKTIERHRHLAVALPLAALILLAGCTTRQVQDSLAGATAQQLIAHGIDDMVRSLPDEDFEPYRGATVHLSSRFLEYPQIRDYADQRLGVELARRFDMQPTDDPDKADIRLRVFYTALGTDQTRRGVFLPLGYVPGLDADSQVNILTLEQFHGIAQMYYYIGPTGIERRGAVIEGRTRSDAVGLPVITIPVSDIDRGGYHPDENR